MRQLLTVTIVVTYLLIIFGATVRAFGAGLACPDWPLCHGQWIPPFDLPVLLEWGHRLVASLVGFGTVIVALRSLSRTYRPRLGWLGGLACGLVILQAVLGGLTVLKLLHFSTVTLHLGTGLLFLGVLVWMRLCLTTSASATIDAAHAPLQRVVGVTLILLYAQVVLGALVSSNYAGLACPDFPTCFGEWMPPLQGLVAYQFAHRVMAFLVLTFALWSAILLLRRADMQLRWLGIALGVSTLVQIQLGISNVLWQLPKAITIAHTGVAAGLLMMLVIIYHRVRHARIPTTH